MASSTGRMKARRGDDRAAQTPSGIPIATEISTAIVISDKVSHCDFPQADQTRVDHRRPRRRAPRQLPLRTITRNDRSGSTNQGSQSRNARSWSMPSSTASRGRDEEAGEQRMGLAVGPGPVCELSIGSEMAVSQTAGKPSDRPRRPARRPLRPGRRSSTRRCETARAGRSVRIMPRVERLRVIGHSRVLVRPHCVPIDDPNLRCLRRHPPPIGRCR